MKPYNFTFKLPSQTFISQAGTGLLDLSIVSGAGLNPLTTAKRLVYSGTSGIPNFFDVAMATTFKLDDIVNVAQYTAMFDAYRINKVTCTIEYLNNVSAVNSTGLMPSVFSYWDKDDATIPANAINIQGKQGVRRSHFNGKNSVTLSARPYIAIPAATPGGGAAAVISPPNRYLDCLNSNIEHYALKLYITDLYLPGSSAVTQAFRFNWTYNVSFRAPLLAA